MLLQVLTSLLLVSLAVSYPVAFPYDHGLVIGSTIPLAGGYPLSGTINNTVASDYCYTTVHPISGVVEPVGPLNSAIYFSISISVNDSVTVSLFSVPLSSSPSANQTTYNYVDSTGSISASGSGFLCSSGTCTADFFCELFQNGAYYVSVEGVGSTSGPEEISYTLTVNEFVENVTIFSRFYSENTPRVDRYAAGNVGPQNFVHYYSSFSVADIERTSTSAFFFAVTLGNVSQTGTSAICISSTNLVGTEIDVKTGGATSDCASLICGYGTGDVSIILNSFCCTDSSSLWIGVRTPSGAASTYTLTIAPQNSNNLPNPTLLTNGVAVTGSVTISPTDPNCIASSGQYPCEQYYYLPKISIPSNALVGPIFYASLNSVYDGTVTIAVSSGFYSGDIYGCNCEVVSCAASSTRDCFIEIPSCDWNSEANWNIAVYGDSLMNGTTVTYALNVTQYIPTVTGVVNLFRDGDADAFFGSVLPEFYNFYSINVDPSLITPDARLTINLYSETQSDSVVLLYNFGSPSLSKNNDCNPSKFSCTTVPGGKGCSIELYVCDSGYQLLPGTHYISVLGSTVGSNFYHEREYTVTVELNYARRLEEHIALPVQQDPNTNRFFKFLPPYGERDFFDVYVLFDRILGDLSVYAYCGAVAGPCPCWENSANYMVSPGPFGSYSDHQEIQLSLSKFCGCTEEIYVTTSTSGGAGFDISLQNIRFPVETLHFGYDILSHSANFSIHQISEFPFAGIYMLEPFVIDYDAHDEIYIEVIPNWVDDYQRNPLTAQFYLVNSDLIGDCSDDGENYQSCEFSRISSDTYHDHDYKHNYPWKCVMIGRNCSCGQSGNYAIEAFVYLSGDRDSYYVNPHYENPYDPDLSFTINVRVRKNVPLQINPPETLKARVRSGEHQHFVIDLNAVSKPLNSWLRINFFAAPTLINQLRLYQHYSESRGQYDLAGENDDCYAQDCYNNILTVNSGYHFEIDPCDFAAMKGLFYFSLHSETQQQNNDVGQYYDYFSEIPQVSIQAQVKNTMELLQTQVPTSHQLFNGLFDFYSATVPSQFPSGISGYVLNVVFESDIENNLQVYQLPTNPTAFCNLCDNKEFSTLKMLDNSNTAYEYRFEEYICSSSLGKEFYFAVGYSSSDEFTPSSYVARGYLTPIYQQSVTLTNVAINNVSSYGLVASFDSSNLANATFGINGQQYLAISFAINVVAGSLLDIKVVNNLGTATFPGSFLVDNLCGVGIDICAIDTNGNCQFFYTFCSAATHTFYFLVDASTLAPGLSDNLTIVVNQFDPIANVINVPALGNTTTLSTTINIPAFEDINGALGNVFYTATVGANAGDTLIVDYIGSAATLQLGIHNSACSYDCTTFPCTIFYCDSESSTWYFFFTTNSNSLGSNSDQITIQRILASSNITIDANSNPLPLNNDSNFGSLADNQWRYHLLKVPAQIDASFSLTVTGGGGIFIPEGGITPTYFPGASGGIFFESTCPSMAYTPPSYLCCNPGINQVFAVVGPSSSYTITPTLMAFDGQNFGTKGFSGNSFSVSATIAPNTLNFLQFTLPANSYIYYELFSNVTTGISLSSTARAGENQYSGAFTTGGCYDSSEVPAASCPVGSSDGSPCFGVLNCYADCGGTTAPNSLSLFSNSYSNITLTVYAYSGLASSINSLASTFTYPVINTSLANSQQQLNDFGQYKDFVFSATNNFGSNPNFVPLESDIPVTSYSRYTIYIENVVNSETNVATASFPFDVYVNTAGQARASSCGSHLDLTSFCIGGGPNITANSWSCAFDYCQTCGSFSLYYSVINSAATTGSYSFSTHVNESLTDVTQFVAFATASANGVTNITNLFSNFTVGYVTIPFGALSDSSRHRITVYGSNVDITSANLYSTTKCNDALFSSQSISSGSSAVFDFDPCYSGKYSAIYPSLILRVTTTSAASNAFFLVNNQAISREVVYIGTVPTSGLTLTKEIVDMQYEFFQFQLPTDSGYSFFTISVSSLGCSATAAPGLNAFFSYFNEAGFPVDVVRPNRVPSMVCESNSLSLTISNDDLCSYFGGIVLLTVYSQPGDQLYSTPDPILKTVASFYSVSVQYSELPRILLSPFCSLSFPFLPNSIQRFEVDYTGYPQLGFSYNFQLSATRLDSMTGPAPTLQASFNAQAFGNSETNCRTWEESGDYSCSIVSLSESCNLDINGDSTLFGKCNFPQKVYLYFDDFSNVEPESQVVIYSGPLHYVTYTPVFVADAFESFLPTPLGSVIYQDSFSYSDFHFYRVVNPVSFVQLIVSTPTCSYCSFQTYLADNYICNLSPISTPYFIYPCSSCANNYIAISAEECSIQVELNAIEPMKVRPGLEQCFPVVPAIYQFVDINGNPLLNTDTLSLQVNGFAWFAGSFVDGCNKSSSSNCGMGCEINQVVCQTPYYIVSQVVPTCDNQLSLSYNITNNGGGSAVPGQALNTNLIYNFTATAGSVYALTGTIPSFYDCGMEFCAQYVSGPSINTLTGISEIVSVPLVSFTNGQRYTIPAGGSLDLSISLPIGTSKITLSFEDIDVCLLDTNGISLFYMFDSDYLDCGINPAVSFPAGSCSNFLYEILPYTLTQTTLFLLLERESGQCPLSFTLISTFVSTSQSLGIPHTGSPIHAFVQESTCGGPVSYSASYLVTVPTNGIFHPFITEANYGTSASIAAVLTPSENNGFSCTAMDDSDGFSSSCLIYDYDGINCDSTETWLITVSGNGDQFVDFGFQVVNQFTPLSGLVSSSILGSYVHAWSATGIAGNSFTVELEVLSGPALSIQLSFDCTTDSCFSENYHCDHGSCPFTINTLADHPGTNTVYIQLYSDFPSQDADIAPGFNRMRTLKTETSTFYNLEVTVGTQNCVSLPTAAQAPFCASVSDNIFSAYASSSIWSYNITSHDLSAQCLYNQLLVTECSYRSTDCLHALKAFACASLFPACDTHGFLTNPSVAICEQISNCGVSLTCGGNNFAQPGLNTSSTDVQFSASPTPITAAFVFPSPSSSNSPAPTYTYTLNFGAPTVVIELPPYGSNLPSSTLTPTPTAFPLSSVSSTNTASETPLPPGVSRSSTFTQTHTPIVNAATSLEGLLLVNAFLFFVCFLLLKL